MGTCKCRKNEDKPSDSMLFRQTSEPVEGTSGRYKNLDSLFLADA